MYIKYLKPYIYDFYLFLKKGHVSKIDSNIEKGKLLILFFISFLILKVGLILIISLLDSINIISIPTNSSSRLTLNERILLVVLLGPILEELSFRLPVVYSKINISITSFSFSYIILSYIYSANFYDLKSSSFTYRVVFSIILSFAIYKIINLNVDKKLHSIWSYNQIFITYFFMTTFTIVHLGNFNYDEISILSVFILLLPYFLSALFFTYIRFKSGLLFSILFHMLNNIIPLVMDLM